MMRKSRLYTDVASLNTYSYAADIQMRMHAPAGSLKLDVFERGGMDRFMGRDSAGRVLLHAAHNARCLIWSYFINLPKIGRAQMLESQCQDAARLGAIRLYFETAVHKLAVN